MNETGLCHDSGIRPVPGGRHHNWVMTADHSEAPQDRHAFISYVHEDEELVDRLQDALEAAGVKVWRDKDDLPPGSDWATEIRQAITQRSLAFIACFSNASDSRARSYQYEELVVAVEQFRQLRPGEQWLFPVRFDDVPLPEYSLGAGRTMDSLHRTDLFGRRRDSNLIRLTAAINQRVGSQISVAPPRPDESGSLAEGPGRAIKRMLREPSLEIELDELVMGVGSKIRDELSNDSQFAANVGAESTNIEIVNETAARLQAYERVLEPLGEILVVAGAWGEQKHMSLWSRAAAQVLNVRRYNGSSRLLSLQEFIPLYLVYVSAIAAVARSNYYSLGAVLETRARRLQGPELFVERLHTGLVFQHAEAWLPTLVTVKAEGTEVTDGLIENYRAGRLGVRYTPVPDYFFRSLRPLFRELIPDDEDYDDLFDQAEATLTLKASVAKAEASSAGRYALGPWNGRYTWKTRYFGGGPTKELAEAYIAMGDQWPPLSQGLFGQDAKLIKEVLLTFLQPGPERF
jgi:hypothetical protein